MVVCSDGKIVNNASWWFGTFFFPYIWNGIIPTEQSFFLQVKIYMKVDLHMVGCRQFAGVRRLA